MATTVESGLRLEPDIPSRIVRGLALLAEARKYALDLSRDEWDFAVEISSLREIGLNNNDLRWLLCRGSIEHATEIRRPKRNGRRFQHNAGLTFNERACFVLTVAGAELLRSLESVEFELVDRVHEGLRRNSEQGPSTATPNWNSQLREFRFADRIIKTFRLPSPNQQTVLTAFEEEAWPLRIDDPLPPDPAICPKRRLHDTIKSLNRNQHLRLVRFSGDGTGQGVCWEPMLDNLKLLRLASAAAR
jgi:hypothetical protein